MDFLFDVSQLNVIINSTVFKIKHIFIIGISYMLLTTIINAFIISRFGRIVGTSCRLLFVVCLIGILTNSNIIYSTAALVYTDFMLDVASKF